MTMQVTFDVTASNSFLPAHNLMGLKFEHISNILNVGEYTDINRSITSKILQDEFITPF